MNRRLRAACAAMAPLVLANCASIVSDNDSSTYIETVPETARCELHGQDFTRVVNTPSSIQLPSSAAPITVACKADGHLNTTATLDTSMDGWILGNIVFGGVVGFVVDAARGAGMKFPPRVTVLLEPESFPDAVARDRWYDERKRQTIEKWDRILQGLRGSCDAQQHLARDCGSEVNAMQANREKELRELEARRQRALVRAT